MVEWRTKLVPLGLASSNSTVATMVAKRYVDGVEPLDHLLNADTDVCSSDDVHNCKYTKKQFATFLKVGRKWKMPFLKCICQQLEQSQMEPH